VRCHSDSMATHNIAHDALMQRPQKHALLLQNAHDTHGCGTRGRSCAVTFLPPNAVQSMGASLTAVCVAHSRAFHPPRLVLHSQDNICTSNASMWHSCALLKIEKQTIVSKVPNLKFFTDSFMLEIP